MIKGRSSNGGKCNEIIIVFPNSRVSKETHLRIRFIWDQRDTCDWVWHGLDLGLCAVCFFLIFSTIIVIHFCFCLYCFACCPFLGLFLKLPISIPLQIPYGLYIYHHINKQNIKKIWIRYREPLLLPPIGSCHVIFV